MLETLSTYRCIKAPPNSHDIARGKDVTLEFILCHVIGSLLTSPTESITITIGHRIEFGDYVFKRNDPTELSREGVGKYAVPATFEHSGRTYYRLSDGADITPGDLILHPENTPDGVRLEIEAVITAQTDRLQDEIDEMLGNGGCHLYRPTL